MTANLSELVVREGCTQYDVDKLMRGHGLMEVNGSAVKIMGDKVLRQIAHELYRVLVVKPVTPTVRNVLGVLVIVALCAGVFGCQGSKRAWSAESRSPDGKMIATAEAFDNSGFKLPRANTVFVYLNHSSSSKQKMLILALSQGKTEADAMKVGMVWLSPTHLEVTYQGPQTIDSQAAKYAGIDISLKEIVPASKPNGTSQ